MWVTMNDNLASPTQMFCRNEVYDIPKSIGEEWCRNLLAEASTTPPRFIRDFYRRLEEGADKPCIFLPFCGEFGHLIMSHIRLVHFHKAKEKIVCCRAGERVLFPSARGFYTTWTDPIPDIDRIATLRDRQPQFPDIIARYPNHYPIQAGGLLPAQEIYCIEPQQQIPFKPRRFGVKVDVCLATRRRAFAPERNWTHYQQLADALVQAGYSFGVVGDIDTSPHLVGETTHTMGNCDEAIDLLQSCKLYIAGDTGQSHLAAIIGARMLIYRESLGQSRDLTFRMEEVNPGRITVLPQTAWTNPQEVIDAALKILEEEQNALA